MVKGGLFGTRLHSFSFVYMNIKCLREKGRYTMEVEEDIYHEDKRVQELLSPGVGPYEEIFIFNLTEEASRACSLE